MTKFDVTGIYVCWYIFLRFYPYRISSELTHRQIALFCMLYILCLNIIRAPLEASAAVSGCHRDISYSLDPVLDKRSAWQRKKNCNCQGR